MSCFFALQAFSRRSFRNAILTGILVVGMSFSAYGMLEIDSLGSGDLIIDQDVGMSGVYLGYSVTNSDQNAYFDLWIEVNGGVWLAPAPREDGVHMIGDLAPGETKTAFFFMATPEVLGGPYSHPVNIRTGGPDGSIIATASFDYITWDSIQTVVLDPILTVSASAEGPVVGSAVDVVITGEVAQLYPGNFIFTSPATNLDFPADVFTLESTRIVLKDEGDGCQTVVQLVQDRLDATAATGGLFCFEYRFRFRIQAVEPSPSPIVPAGYLQLGQQMKHGSLDCEFNPCELPPTEPSPTAVPGVALAGVRLAQNAPNPFNPRTTIAFELDKGAAVSLRVFDVSGCLVKDLIAGESRAPGRHELVWNGRDDSGRQVASGTYFYRLEGGEFAETKRMVLMK